MRTLRKNPKKPAWPTATIVFTKQGKVYKNIEKPPDTLPEQEIHIAEKFLYSIRERKHIKSFRNLKAGENKDDDVKVIVDGQSLDIQITSAVDKVQRQLDIQRSQYCEAMSADKDILKFFRGYQLEIVDTGNEPFLPKLKSNKGNKLLGDIKNKLLELSKTLKSLGPNKIRSRSYELDDGIKVWVTVRRINDKQTQIYCDGGRTFLKNEKPTPVLDAISKKSKYPKSNKLWLLIYMESFWPFEEYEKEAILTYLEEKDKKNLIPYKRIYLFFPYPNRKNGIVYSLYPIQGKSLYKANHK